GASSVPASSSGTTALIASSRRTRSRSMCIIAPRTGSRWASFSTTGVAFSPSMLRSSTAPVEASATRSSRASASKATGSPPPPYPTPGTRPVRRRRRAAREPPAARRLTSSLVLVVSAIAGGETLAIGFVRDRRAEREQPDIDAGEDVARALHLDALHHGQPPHHRPRDARLPPGHAQRLGGSRLSGQAL